MRSTANLVSSLLPERLESEDYLAIAAVWLLPWAFGGVEIWAYRSAALLLAAAAAVSLFLTDVEMPHLASRGSELVLAEKVLDAVGLLDDLVPMLDPVLRRHVLHAVERMRLSTIDQLERLQYRYAVGFKHQRKEDLTVGGGLTFIREGNLPIEDSGGVSGKYKDVSIWIASVYARWH